VDLAAAKARGVTVGNPKIDEARQRALAEIVDRADQRAANVIPIMRQIQRSYDDRVQEQRQICGRGPAAVDQALQG
jgi:hypothetical protein